MTDKLAGTALVALWSTLVWALVRPRVRAATQVTWTLGGVAPIWDECLGAAALLALGAWQTWALWRARRRAR